MSEVGALLGVLQAIDRAVVEDPELVARVAPLYPPYSRGAAGWVASFAHAVGVPPARLAPSPDAALQELADSSLAGRHDARTLMAVAALARVRPEFAPSGRHEEVAAAALAPHTPDRDVDTGAKLLSLVHDPESFAGHETWSQLMELALRDGLVTQALAATSAPVCHGELVSQVVAGHTRLVPALTTTFTTDQLDLAAIQPYLEPLNWPDCSQLWISMSEQPPTPGTGSRRILETIGDLDGSWTVVTSLDFITRGSADDGSVTVAYDLSADQSEGDGQVVVDRGFIDAWEHEDGITVKTAKRVAFSTPLAGPGLAMAACALGWATYGEDMMFSCAANGDGATNPWTPSGGHDDDGHPGGGGPGSAKHCLEELVAESVTALRLSFERTMAGTYTSSHLVQDVADGWSRAARWITCWAEMAQDASAGWDPGGDQKIEVVSDWRPLPPGTTSTVAGPLAEPFGSVIPPSRVVVEQDADGAAIRLVVDATGCKPGVYQGSVSVTTVSDTREVPMKVHVA